VLAEIEAKRAGFATVEDSLSTKGATGKLVLHVLGPIGEFERSLIIERTHAVLAASQARADRWPRARNGARRYATCSCIDCPRRFVSQ
jgi:DNA invertase Pin-like site-specific DNA recombinase